MTAPSPTQRRLRAEDVAALVRVSFGENAVVVHAEPMAGGTFAAVWRVRLGDGRDTVLKVGPPVGARLLSYETGLIAAESAYLRLARDAGAPVPEVLAHGSGTGDLSGDWLFTGLLEGTALPELPAAADDAGARYDSGSAVARVHRVTGDRYGYSGDRACGTTWRQAFTAMVDELLDDAGVWDIALPVPVETVRGLVARHADVLDAVDRPALLHVDLWDGNVLAAVDDAGRTRLTGLVDGERYLYGDRLVDFVSPLLLRRIEDHPEHPFVQGYQAESDEQIVFDEAARRRLTLYRLHLYLIMLVEMPSRGIVGAVADDRHAWLNPALEAELARLQHAPPVR